MTALPTFRLAVNPTRILVAPLGSCRCGAACTTKPGPPDRRPALATRRKSARAFKISRVWPTKLEADPRNVASSGVGLAALRPARCQNPPAGDRRHPRPEPMTAFANQVAGLISTLHGCNSDQGSLSSGGGYIVAPVGGVNSGA